MVNNQAYLFMVFTLVGVVIGVLFDIFRILRKTVKTKDIITNIEDILFWLITGIIIIYSMYIFCDGELRFFMVIGLSLGTLMYMITFSRYVISISVFTIKFLKKIVIYPLKVIFNILKKIFFRPIFFICFNLRKNLSQNAKKIKKIRGFFQKKEKYNSI